jgi:K+-sensing histidine kinase KdpD
MIKRPSPFESSGFPEKGRHAFRSSAAQFLLGVAGLALITFAAVRLHLQPGSTSLLDLIDIVFVSLNSGFVYSIAVSLVAVSCLNFYFLPLFDPAGSRNPLAS